MQSGCDVSVCLSACLSFCLSGITDQEPIVTWVLPVGENGGFFLKHGGGFQEIYELHFGPLAKYSKSYLNALAAMLHWRRHTHRRLPVDLHLVSEGNINM